MRNILFAASEGVPFIKTGGLADVVGSLPRDIDKEYYDMLKADSNVKKIEVGTAVVTTDKAIDGITLEASGATNLAGAEKLSGDLYSFEGILNVGKDARETSYSGIGYIKLTMADGKVIVVYSDYAKRNHAFALADLVDKFDDAESDGAASDNAANNDAETTTAEPAEEAEKKGCKGSVAGVVIVLAFTLGTTCIVARKTKENDI